MKRINPIRHTVKHFMGAGELRLLRKISRERLDEKHSKKSNFVRFLESLENRGPMTMKEDFYSKWTKMVRVQMEEAGTWPQPDTDTNLWVLAEYLSRLQAAFWAEFSDVKWYQIDWFYEVYKPESRFRPHRKDLRKIWMKIRSKGMRDRTYKMSKWGSHVPSEAWIEAYIDTHGCEKYRIQPYTPFNNHGNGI